MLCDKNIAAIDFTIGLYIYFLFSCKGELLVAGNFINFSDV